jgi:hypothetical protein
MLAVGLGASTHFRGSRGQALGAAFALWQHWRMASSTHTQQHWFWLVPDMRRPGKMRPASTTRLTEAAARSIHPEAIPVDDSLHGRSTSHRGGEDHAVRPHAASSGVSDDR